VCIAVLNIEETLAFYENLFGVTKSGEIETIEDQGVKAALVRVGASQLEFIQPIDNENGVAKFIERRGEGVHHICFEVDNLESKLNDLDLAGVQLIDKEPRDGLSGTIGFIHPKSTRGVLIELVDQKTARR
jgi:methylmalonyl-CoA epimerase|tara:strand:+ start:255 stop:647 length:393 start_codon:yes stop_codon:yes gene_type:complete